MPDFNNKKEMLRRLRAKRERNRALWLPCVIAELFVKAWYAVICRAGLALSDKNGRFLGLGAVSDKPKKRRQDDIVYVKRPFWGRLLSATLAAAFVMMFVPEITPVITASAASLITLEYGGETKEFFQDKDNPTKLFLPEVYDAATAVSASITECIKANGYLNISWEVNGNTNNYKIFGYSILVTNTTDGQKYEKKESMPTPKVEKYVIELENTKNYTVNIYPIINAPAWTYIPSIDPDNPGLDYTLTPPSDENDVAPITSNNAGSMNVGVLNAELDKPQLKDLPDITEGVDNNPKAELKWSAVDGAYGYKIYRKQGNEEWSELRGVILNGGAAAGTEKTFTDEDITPGTHYSYFVEAYAFAWGGNEYNINNPGIITSSGGSTKQSASEKANSVYNNGYIKDFYVAPAQPALVLESRPEEHLINVSWDYIGNADGFVLVRSDHDITDEEIAAAGYDSLTKYLLNSEKKEFPGLKWLPVDTGQSDNSFDDLDIVSGQNYWYYGISYIQTDENKLLYSMPRKRNKDMNLKLEAPQSLKAVTEDGRVTLTWNTVENADGYILSITKVADNNGREIPLADRKTLTFNLKENRYVHEEFDGNDLLNGEVYQYFVQAFANVKTSKDDLLVSDPSSVRTVTVGILLDIPQDMLATTQDGMNQIEWSDVDGAEGYILYYSRNGSSWQEVDVSDTGFTHTGLNNGDKYSYYTVAYKTVNGVRVYSDPSVTVSIIVGVPLDAPKDFIGNTADGIVTLEWSDTEGAEGYILSFRKNGGSWQTVDLSEPGFEHMGLNNGDKYTYYVVAYKNVNGIRIFSKPSNYLTFTIGDDLDSPKDFTAVTTDGQVNLSWTASEGAQGYILYAYGGGRSYQYDLSRTTYLHSGLKNGDTWTYYVVAYKTVNGKRVYSSPTKSITVKIGVSLNAVIDLIATAGNRQVDLEWSDVEGAEGYVVYLYNSKTMEFEPITVVSDTAYSHVGLTNGKKYTYMVAPFKTINGQRFYGEYSMAVDATPTTGSITDIDHALNIKGTTPYGISHSEYISANANHGAFEDSVDVYFTTNKESTKAVKDVLKTYAKGLKSFIIYPFDISVYEENTLIKVEPNDGYSVTVTMPIPDRLIAYRDYITVVHIGERTEEEEEIDENAADWIEAQDGRLEVLPCAVLDIDNVWCVQFVCSNFSPYALVIYKEHIDDVSAGGGVIDGSFADTFNSGVLLFTALPDIMPNNKRLKVVRGGRKRYRIKNVEKK